MDEDGRFDTPGVTFSLLEDDLWTGASAEASTAGPTITGSFSGDGTVSYSGFGVMIDFEGEFGVER